MQNSTGVESEARYRGLLEAAPDAMVVVDQAGEIVLLNLQAEKQFGYQRDDLVGRAITLIIPTGFAERLIADDLRSSADALAQQIGTGIELVGRRRDGTEFPLEIMLSPLDSADGILVTAAIRDITVRKEAEAVLRGQARLLDLAREAIIVRDSDNVITYWSKGAEATYGWTADEAIGRVTYELLGTTFPGSRNDVDGILEAVGDWQGELGHIASDGRRLTVESRQSVERDPQQRIRAILESTETSPFARPPMRICPRWRPDTAASWRPLRTRWLSWITPEKSSCSTSRLRSSLDTSETSSFASRSRTSFLRASRSA
jgi:PAS domain S-box-containing protein